MGRAGRERTKRAVLTERPSQRVSEKKLSGGAWGMSELPSLPWVIAGQRYAVPHELLKMPSSSGRCEQYRGDGEIVRGLPG